MTTEDVNAALAIIGQYIAEADKLARPMTPRERECCELLSRLNDRCCAAQAGEVLH